MEKLKIVLDSEGNRVVLISDTIFTNRKNIDWNKVESYLEQFIGEIIEITESKDVIYIGKTFPDEYAGSKYTRRMKGARAKAKANAARGIIEMIQIATEKEFRENHKDKHLSDAKKGWYYFRTRFALPIYDNDIKTQDFNIYSACLVVNCASNEKLYVYDLVDIKKEASNPLKIKK